MKLDDPMNIHLDPPFTGFMWDPEQKSHVYADLERVSCGWRPLLVGEIVVVDLIEDKPPFPHGSITLERVVVLSQTCEALRRDGAGNPGSPFIQINLSEAAEHYGFRQFDERDALLATGAAINKAKQKCRDARNSD